MPQLRSRNVVTSSEVKSTGGTVTSPSSLDAGVGHKPAKKMGIRRSSHMARKRKSEQPLSSCLEPSVLSNVSCEQFVPLLPMQMEQGESSQRRPGKKKRRIQCRRTTRSKKGVALPVSDAVVCEDWEAAPMAATAHWEETVRKRKGQDQQLLGTTLQNKFSAGIKRNKHSAEGPNLSGFQERLGSSGKKGKRSFMEMEFQTPSSKEEIESTERHDISCLPEPEVVQPTKGTCSTEMKNTGSVMVLPMQIPDHKKNLGPQESLSELKPQEEVDLLEKLDGDSLIGERKPGAQEKGKRHLSKKGGTSLMKRKLQGPREGDQFALLELHTQCPQSKKEPVSRRKRDRNTVVSQHLQGLIGQNQAATREKMHKHCMKEEQQTSNPQEGADSLRENAEEEWKAIEQDSSTQAVKKLRTNQNRSEDCKEKEPHYSKFSTFTALGETQSKTLLCHPVTKTSGVQYEKRNPRTDQIKCLQSFSVTTAEKARNVCAKGDAEHCRSALNPCNVFLCATDRNPFVRLEACGYINTFVKSSAGGTTSSYRLSRFFHVAEGKRKHNFLEGSVEQCDMDCSTSKMQNETSPIKGGLLFHKGEKNKKNIKITEKSAVQNILTDTSNEHSDCQLQTEAVVAISSSFTVLGLNHKESSLSHDHTSDLQEAQNKSVWRKNSTKLVLFEDGFKKTSERSVIAKGEISNTVAHDSDASGSLRVPAQVHNVSSHKSKSGEKLNKVNKKLQQITCQRTVPMTGKNVCCFESCARTSEWVRKNHGSISDRKRPSKAAFEGSSDKSSIKAVGNSAVTENLGQLDFHGTSTEINKESMDKIMDPSTECLPSFETPESSSLDVRETLGTSNENVELPVSMDRSNVASNHNVQEVKAALNFTTKQKDKKKGAATKKNLFVTVQNGTSTSNNNRVVLNCEASVGNQTSNLKKVLNTGNLTNFKIPLCRSNPESVHSLERKTCSPLELLDSRSVSRRQKTGEETSLVNSKQQPLPVARDTKATASVKEKVDYINGKDMQHDGCENLSNQTSALPEHFSLDPYPVPDGQLESSVRDIRGTDCVLNSNFPDDSWNAVDQPVPLEINNNKSKEVLSQHKRQNFSDVLEAYEDDVLIIDVIQDDPDLFGTSNEEELAVLGCENCPLEASSTSICIKEEEQDLKPMYPIMSEYTDSVDDAFRNITTEKSGMSNDSENTCGSLLKAKDIKTHNSSRESCTLEGVAEDSLEDGQLKELDELLKSFNMDEKLSFADGMPDVKLEKKDEAQKSDCKCKDLVPCELLAGLPLQAQKVDFLSEATVMKPRTNDYRFSGKSSLLPLPNCGDFEAWKIEKNAVASYSVQQILEMMELPRKYCRFYFTTLRGCERAKCWFWHVPEQGDEKIFMTILRTYISIKESGLLKRAVQIFVKYYKEVTPGVHFDSQVLNDLLISLLKNSLLQEVFWILHVTTRINTLPAVDVLLKVFEHVASLNLRNAVPTLISTFCKLIDAGMFLEFEHFDNIIKFLHQLQVSSQEINTILNIKSRRLQERHFENNWLFDFNLAVAEIQHCKERNDWTKLGTLYVSARTGCEHFDDLQKLSLCIAEILTRDFETARPGVPFCDFADAVIKNSQHNEADRIFIGRTGISVMYSYHKVLQWMKGRKVLDKLHELQIHFTILKGLTGAERLASRCDIVNKAAEIFLKTGNLDGATWVLRESEWTTNAPLWPCGKVDILNRHDLLCTLVREYLKKSSYRQAFEVLQNLPGFHNHSDTVDVSQYSCLFNKLLNACFESKNLGVSSSAVDFMLSKNIAIDFFLLRGLITALGRSSLWSKARTYYKSALSLGCYPRPQGNLYHKVTTIPSYMSEVEMLLAIEILLVSNASVIQSPTAACQTLQIVLKRGEDQRVQNNSDYQAAVERLILAARISDPKLLLKHMTMNVNTDEVYSLELTSALKWLQENMKWAGKVWLFQ